MSIFKSTLSKVVSSQLKARETVVSQLGDSGAKTKNGDPIYRAGINDRDSRFLMYTTGKNSWVRLRSFVDYTSYKFDDDKKNKIRLKKDEKYTGNNLSKKWVLEGGTLYNGKSLRSGVGDLDSVYGSNLDFNNQDLKSDAKIGLGIDRGYGLRPMPGITSVEVMNKSAYGSLREATINFFCWDRHQLEELEILYMRPGYSCFLEWGWSQYLDHSIASVNEIPNNIKIKTFDSDINSVLDTWDDKDDNLTDDNIYLKIDSAVNKYKGNYDAMLGYIKNYSWQLMPNGGFQCSTTLISRGEVINTIKASSNPNIIIGSEKTTTTTVDENKTIYSQFEKIFLNLVAHINDQEFAYSISFQKTLAPGQFYSVDKGPQRDALIAEADKVYNDINSRIKVGSYKGFAGNWEDPQLVDFNPATFDLNLNLAVKLIDGGTEEGIGVEYISMNAFIAILTEFFLPKNKKNNKPAISIAIPNNTPCLASEDSVSIDPTTCIINNSKATFICDNTNGFKPQLYSEISMISSPSSTTNSTNIPEFIQSGTNIGAIGNIYVSISKILQVYRNLSGGPDGVDVIELLKEILDACSFALGGINDFKLYNDRSTVQIIDVKYFETKGKNSKFKFDLIGLKSICRDVKINSRIFSEQSTMIAIGATSGDQNANLGDIYTSTQNYFNYGLKDRILKTTYSNDKASDKIVVDGVELKGEAAYYFTIYSNVEALTSYVNINVLGLDTDGDSYFVTKLPQSNQVVNAGSLLKTYHYQINGKDTNFKSLIPFELEITLDGISGFIVGQIFTIDKSILPKDYFNKNLGFIITGVNHSLQNNDWVTTVKTQICLLENDKIEEMFGVDKAKLKKIITKIREEARKKGWLLCALADYMVKETIDAIFLFLNPKNNTWPQNDLFLKALSDGNKDAFVGTPGNTPEFTNWINYLNVGTVINVEDYLKNWWGYHATLNIPDFPTSYDDLISTDIPGTGKNTFNLKKFVDNFISDDAGSAPRSQVAKNEGKDADESAFKRFWDSIFIGKVINDQISNPSNYSNLKGLLIKFSEVLTSSGVTHTQQTISDKSNNPVLLKTPRPLFQTSTGTYYDGNTGFDYPIYSAFEMDALDPMFTIYYNYLLTHAAELDLTVHTPPASFEPIKAHVEKIIR
jgi:hypothetical protein